MIIDPGHDLRLGPVGQERPADDVQLPQRHRLISFPPQVAVLGPLPRAGLDQPVPDQDPVDAHPRRRRDHPGLAQLVRQPQRTPLRMLPAHLAHYGLDIALTWCGHLSGRRERSARAPRPPRSYRRIQACTLCRDTPDRAATSVTGTPA